jgi:tetratricopeptide (TPR) repeat protein
MTRRTWIGSRVMAVVHQDARRSLVDALPGLAGVAVLVWWSTDQGGYFQKTFYPGTALLLGVLVATAIGAPETFRGLPRVGQVALGALVLFTAWSFLSISWADAPGPAWDAANRSLLYLILFTLFSRNTRGSLTRRLVLGAWTLAIIVLAVVVLLKLPDVLNANVTLFAPGLEQPLGYSNANAALFLMAMWPAVTLASSFGITPWLRGIFTAGVVVLAETSLLSESRGSVVAAGIVLVVLFVVVPRRVRTFLTLIPPAIAIAVTTPHTLHIANLAGDNPSATSQLGDVAAPVLIAAVVAGLIVAIAGELEDRRPPSEAVSRVGTRIVAIAMALIVIGGIAGGLAVAGNPVDRVDNAWHEFKQVGAPDQTAPSGHLSAGFGGARYDYYRVALDVFKEHPLAGIGAGNFSEDYIQRGRVGERPTSPHSLEFGTLVETGLVGAALLLAAMAAGLIGAAGAARRSGRFSRAVAAGGLLTFVYWFVQSSADWLWEFPALGGAAFAFLGLAVGAAGRRAFAPARREVAIPAAVAAAVLAVAAFLSLLAPWASDVEVRRAADSWATYPDAAFRQLDKAADYNRLSERPGLLAGAIAIQLRRYNQARTAFEQVLDRDPRNLTATISLAALESRDRHRAKALALLRHALELAPADQTATTELAAARKGRLDPQQVARDLVANAAARVH